ncbi:GNAT family N-acetyltransferase [Kineococcus endophyticus]|uniref:GNAT family N-acetyltransferase n=1 Tax=Kineococcus endophyticus TaxID=1181883 RepID=A0ABV3P6Y3_9ACTN
MTLPPSPAPSRTGVPTPSLVTRVVTAADPVPGWEELTAATGALFAGPAWVSATTVLGGPVRVATVRGGDAPDSPLLGVLPFVVDETPLPGVAGRPVVRFAGTGPSDYGTVPVAPGADRRAVVAALLDAAVAAAGPAGPVLDLQQVSDLDPTAQDVRAWAAARGRRVRVRAQAETIRRTFGPEDGRESKNRRTKDRKTLKRLGELGTVEVCGELLPDPTDCSLTDGLLAELRAVDAAHPNADHRNQPWTGATGDLLALFLRTADPASRWLTGVRLDGRLVAYSFELVTDRVVATYLCSYRREVAEVGVGTLLLHDVRRRAYAHGAVVLDLLRGLEPYKFRLATSTHVSRRIVVLPDGRLRWTALGAALTWRQDLRPHVQRVRAWRSRRGTAPQDRPTSAE